MSDLNSFQIDKAQLLDLLDSSSNRLAREIARQVPVSAGRRNQNLRTDALAALGRLNGEIRGIIEAGEDMDGICAAVKAAVGKVAESLKAHKPETRGRDGMNTRDARVFDTLPRAFTKALRNQTPCALGAGHCPAGSDHAKHDSL